MNSCRDFTSWESSIIFKHSFIDYFWDCSQGFFSWVSPEISLTIHYGIHLVYNNPPRITLFVFPTVFRYSPRDLASIPQIFLKGLLQGLFPDFFFENSFRTFSGNSLQNSCCIILWFHQRILPIFFLEIFPKSLRYTFRYSIFRFFFRISSQL